MCIIFIGIDQHDQYPLIILSNRDEYRSRPTSKAHFWHHDGDDKHKFSKTTTTIEKSQGKLTSKEETIKERVLAGIDLKEGGTWLGITTKGRFSAITNIRCEKALIDEATATYAASKTDDSSASTSVKTKSSRGYLVKQYLTQQRFYDEEPKKYLQNLLIKNDNPAVSYNPFNFLVGNIQTKELYVYSNMRPCIIEKLTPGIHGISNEPFCICSPSVVSYSHSQTNSCWPKVRKGIQKLQNYLSSLGSSQNIVSHKDQLFELMKDSELTPDDLLPRNTGLTVELERLLSSIFINLDNYGTVSTTIILVNKENHAHFWERTYKYNGKDEEVQYNFRME